MSISNNNNKIMLLGNKWMLYNQLSLLFDELIDENGRKKIDSVNSVKKIEKKVRIKQFDPQIQYLILIEKFILLLEPTKFYAFPRHLMENFAQMREIILKNYGIIRTIRTLYKYPEFLGNFSVELSRIEKKIVNLQSLISETWADHPFDSQDNSSFTLEAPKEYRDYINMWYQIEIRKDSRITIDFNKMGRFHDFQELSFIEEFVKDLLKTKEKEIKSKSSGSLKSLKDLKNIKNDVISSISLMEFAELIKKVEISSMHVIQDKTIFRELLFFLKTQEGLTLLKSPNLSEKEIQKSIVFDIQDYIERIFALYLSNLSLNFGLNFNFSSLPHPLKDYSQHILRFFDNQIEQLTEQHQGDFKGANQDLQPIGKKIFENIAILNQWIDDQTDLLQPWVQIGRRMKKSLNSLRGEINQKLEDFEQYAQSLQEHNTKMELEDIISNKIHELESLLNEYQETTAPIIDRNFPEIEELKKIVKDYLNRMIHLKKDMNQILKEYKSKDLDIVPLVSMWENKYDEVLNRTKFSLRKNISELFAQFNTVLEEEKEFSDTLKNINVHDEIPINFSGDLINPERFTVNDLRSRIAKLNNKIGEVKEISNKLTTEKERYTQLLEGQLKEQGLESKKCIICHKLVNVAEDHYIKCEFCGSLSHYTCAVWWLNKYNSCPVCNNKYTIPNNDLYDPNEIS